MNQQLSIVGAVLRKDLRLFWPLAVITVALVLIGRMDSVLMELGAHPAAIIQAVQQIALPLAAVVLVLLLIQEDAVVSVNHDWLTRPISGGALLAAKAIFIVVTFIGSSIVGQTLDEMYRGRGMAEALLGGVVFGAKGNTWLVLVGVTALASLTSSLRQAIVLAIATAFSVVAVWYVSVSISGMLYANGRFGADWIVERSLMLLVIATGAGVLWLQYTQRRTQSSWILIGFSATAMAIALSLLSWPRGFAIQQSLAPAPSAAKAVLTEPAAGCFVATQISDRNGLFTAAYLGAEMMRVHVERVFAPGDMIFQTSLIQREAPRGSKLIVDRVVGSYRHDGKDEESTLQLARFTSKWTETEGTLSANHYWTLTKADYDRLAAFPDVDLRLDYYLTLLAPTATIELAADGRRAFYPGIGECSATQVSGASEVEVNCLKMGAQPALLSATAVGASDSQGKASDFPNYVPTALDFLGGKRHMIRLGVAGDAGRVLVTAFEAQANFKRSIVSRGVLGGPVTNCAAPGVG